MLSYRHAFHAGNHADVLKHVVLVALLRHLAQKEKPYWYIDTHAGAGLYSLDSGYATKLSEFHEGIERLWGRTDCPPLVADYLAQVRLYNQNGRLHRYPGSPLLAAQLLRPQDHMRLFELHSSDIGLLGRNLKSVNNAIVDFGEGLQGLKSCLPPPPRRALVLIDPSYEVKTDYGAVVAALKDALTRFSSGTYALWYPHLPRLEARELPDRLKKLPTKSWLHVSLSVAHASTQGKGMTGSGMFIANPPWTLHDSLKTALPWLTEVLKQDDGAHFTLEQLSA